VALVLCGLATKHSQEVVFSDLFFLCGLFFSVFGSFFFYKKTLKQENMNKKQPQAKQKQNQEKKVLKAALVDLYKWMCNSSKASCETYLKL